MPAYNQIRKPNWHSLEIIRHYYNTHPNAYAEVQVYHLQDADSMLYRDSRPIRQAALDKTSIDFVDFPVLETRLCQLRHYIDDQKPRVPRHVWRYNKDSVDYYTFCPVVNFGVLSIILAMGSLAVSAAETWAAFRVLDMASSPSPLSS